MVDVDNRACVRGWKIIYILTLPDKGQLTDLVSRLALKSHGEAVVVVIILGIDTYRRC